MSGFEGKKKLLLKYLWTMGTNRKEWFVARGEYSSNLIAKQHMLFTLNPTMDGIHEYTPRKRDGWL